MLNFGGVGILILAYEIIRNIARIALNIPFVQQITLTGHCSKWLPYGWLEILLLILNGEWSISPYSNPSFSKQTQKSRVSLLLRQELKSNFKVTR